MQFPGHTLMILASKVQEVNKQPKNIEINPYKFSTTVWPIQRKMLKK